MVKIPSSSFQQILIFCKVPLILQSIEKFPFKESKAFGDFRTLFLILLSFLTIPKNIALKYKSNTFY